MYIWEESSNFFKGLIFFVVRVLELDFSLLLLHLYRVFCCFSFHYFWLNWKIVACKRRTHNVWWEIEVKLGLSSITYLESSLLSSNGDLHASTCYYLINSLAFSFFLFVFLEKQRTKINKKILHGSISKFPQFQFSFIWSTTPEMFG